MNYQNQTINLNPTPEAVCAMYIYSAEYAAQRGGSMDFWGKLSENQQSVCRRLLNEIAKAKNNHD